MASSPWVIIGFWNGFWMSFDGAGTGGPKDSSTGGFCTTGPGGGVKLTRNGHFCSVWNFFLIQIDPAKGETWELELILHATQRPGDGGSHGGLNQGLGHLKSGELGVKMSRNDLFCLLQNLAWLRNIFSKCGSWSLKLMTINAHGPGVGGSHLGLHGGSLTHGPRRGGVLWTQPGIFWH